MSVDGQHNKADAVPHLRTANWQQPLGIGFGLSVSTAQNMTDKEVFSAAVNIYRGKGCHFWLSDRENGRRLPPPLSLPLENDNSGQQSKEVYVIWYRHVQRKLRNLSHNSSRHAQLSLHKWMNQLWHLLIPAAGSAIVISFPKNPEKSIQDNPKAKHEQTNLRCTKPNRRLSTPRQADAPSRSQVSHHSALHLCLRLPDEVLKATPHSKLRTEMREQ